MRALLAGIASLLLASSFWYIYPPYPSDNERFGVGLAGGAETLSQYDVTQLHAGWYLNWGTALHPPHPGGMEYVQNVRIRRGSSYSPDKTTIAEIATANPGSIWLIGNEPDCIWQDNSRPDQYAVIYHDLYIFIKAQDPTAQIAIGGVVQATPLRLQYLDMVVEEYANRYGEMIPVDVWNVHGFILREKRGDWGCDIPPGIDAAEGMVYAVRDQDNIDIFKEQVLRFRQWMKEKGEQNKPLIISEYGILWPWDPDKPLDMPDEDGRTFDYTRVRDFMLATFDFFLGTDRDGINTDLGYPEDEYRLVQAWAWYSLDDDIYGDDGTRQGEGYNGDLFEGESDKQFTPLGQAFADYVLDNALITEYVDVYPAEVSLQPIEPIYGQPVTVAVTAQVANYGNITTTAPIEVSFWEGDPHARGTLLGSATTTSTVPPRYRGTRPAQIAWQTVATGTHRLFVEVDPGETMAESKEDNNLAFYELSFYPDWTVAEVESVPRTPPISQGEVMTLTLQARIGNKGTAAAEGVGVQFFEGSILIGEATLDTLQRPKGSSTVQVPWPVERPGPYEVRVVVDPYDRFQEPNESDNEYSATILIPSHQLFLPLALKAFP